MCVPGPTVPACRCGRSQRVGGVVVSDSEPDVGGRRRLGPVPALDGYRGLAVLLVLVVHTQEITASRNATGIALVDGFIRAGFLGVDLFFVLSGFLITALLSNELDRTRHVAYGRFYARRGLRLLPALYCFLLAHLAFALASGMDLDQEFTSLFAALFYVSNWQVVLAPDSSVHHFSHLWSLAVEEQFYLVWPFVIVGFLGSRQSARTVARILVPVIVGVALWRVWLFGSHPWFEIIERTDTRVDQLLIGALLALLWTRRRIPSRGLVPAAWAASTVLLVMLFTSDADDRALFAGGMTVFALAAGVVVLALVEGEWSGGRLFELRPIRAVGRVSYGVYLWHMPVFFVCARADALPVGLRVVLALVVTAAVVMFSWYFVEQPALRLKERFRSRDHAPRPGDTPWPSSLRRSLLAVAALVAAAGITGHFVGVWDGRVPHDRFEVGDADRSGYWAWAGLETVAIDDFDGEGEGLGHADEGGEWTSVAGSWDRVGGRAAVSGDG